ncbi:MAG: glycosyltransferase family 39 protein [Acidobacteriales bacterium]|nr:glycosyltransferase family 39 protein [Candidatus Koribacter versatilis]MBI3644978.1 glycosyltransferase family 39 protein [Terriglobales bacterium]
MNSAEASEPEQPRTESLSRPNNLLSDWRIAALVLIALWSVIYMVGLSTPALLDDADTVHAEAAREMVLRHDWVTLYANGVRYLEKAPLMYWSVATSYTLFGVNEWSTRFPLMLGVLAMILATYGLGRWAFGSEGGFDSGLVLATALGPYLFTRFLIPDVLVGLWLTLTFWLFLKSLEETTPSRWVCWGLAAVCALNVMTKGLIGLVFPAGAIGLYLLLTGNLKHLFKLRLFSSALVFLAIAAPWHILAARANPAQGQVRGFLWFYFVNEHFLRFLNKRVPRDYDTVPLLLFWALLIVWLVPWSVFVPQGLLEVPRRWRDFHSQMSRRQRANLLFLLWSLVIVGFFSFSTRQEYYTIPAIPGMALLVGGWLARERTSAAVSPERRSGRISSAALLAIGVIIAIAGFALLSFSKAPPPGIDLSDLLKKHPQDYALSFGHILDLTPQAMGAFRVPLLGFSLALLLGALANWILRRRGRAGAGNAALAAMMVVVLACVHSAFAIFSPILSSKDLALAIQQYCRPGDVIVVVGKYENASALNFYTGVPLRSLREPAGNMWYGSRFPDAPRVFETQASFTALWSGPQRVFLWAEEENPGQLRGLAFYEVARRGGKIIFTNQPLAASGPG